MRFFLFDIFQHRIAHGPKWITGVEYMKNNIRRVNNLVKLAVNPSRCALCVDRFDVIAVSLSFDD